MSRASFLEDFAGSLRAGFTTATTSVPWTSTGCWRAMSGLSAGSMNTHQSSMSFLSSSASAPGRAIRIPGVDSSSSHPRGDRCGRTVTADAAGTGDRKGQRRKRRTRHSTQSISSQKVTAICRLSAPGETLSGLEATCRVPGPNAVHRLRRSLEGRPARCLSCRARVVTRATRQYDIILGISFEFRNGHRFAHTEAERTVQE